MGEVNNKHYTVQRLYLCNGVKHKNIIINVLHIIINFIVFYSANTETNLFFFISLIIRKKKS